jgi:LAS superfamily LD-carboxypeptidase LdcB
MNQSTPCFRWLQENARRYGMEVLQWYQGGRLVEPWHWQKI